MKLSDFDYDLPRELIAQYPLRQRDSCRLMVVNRKDKSIQHRSFLDMGSYLEKGDLLVLNDTKVLPCRLKGRRKTGANVEVLLLHKLGGMSFEALLKPARLKVGERIDLDSGRLTAEITAKNEIKFFAGDIDEIYAYGMMPLPPYIKREPLDSDKLDYQTVYAANEGAVASPTAGLHFTSEIMNRLESQGINLAYLTLHVGVGTFKPVKCEDIISHRMEPEQFNIPEQALKLIEGARSNKKRILAVGTTSMRALETYALGKKAGDTDLFIYPGYEFKITDCLLTNFHLPKTTLFMLTCAFAGTGLIKQAYREAVDEKYRFYSYGDAMLIL